MIYGVTIVSISEKIDHIIMASDCRKILERVRDLK